jgi:ABC-type antimicrobial peptide transport system permease subunit
MKLTNTLALRHLRVNKRQTAFTLTSSGLAAAMLVGVGGIAYSFYNAFLEFARATGRIDSDSLKEVLALLYVVVPFLALIIFAGAVVVISNAFSISAGEQVRQFGILKSVGATTRQIRQSVMAEGRFIGAAAIPAGIIVGYIVTVIGAAILNNFLSGIDVINDGGTGVALVFHAAFHVPTLVASCALAFATILLSAYRVARRVGKLSAIDAIRQKGEAVSTKRSMKTSRLTRALFGFEGTLAAKSLKRAKRKYRATVVSLVTSVVLMLISASFGRMLYTSAVIIRPEIPGNVRVSVRDYNNRLNAEKALSLLEAYGNVTIIAEYDDEHSYYYGTYFHCQTDTPDDFADYAERALSSLESDSTSVYIINLDKEQRQIKQVYTMLMTFIYCFVGMLAAVSVTGVLATISSNISLRTAEFAVLQAVGLDSRGLRRILNLESLLYGMKSLIIGLPLGIALSYVMYRLFQLQVDFTFAVPWSALVFCVAGVFCVTTISMRYASGRLRRSNVADAMRSLNN